ncbi:hypothetical protein ALC57_00270 [Trachymyrmex cornetzi]|uniref:Uncharacterized protein n=1 Tax=Trachymyrmex cornetzi TaxID=471704 RepID=A0A151JSP5_9HYME|nr:hypothetical protein ALC57_00270 [Trachymyrmex cornetzi]
MDSTKKSIAERERTAKLIAKIRASIRKKHRALKTDMMEKSLWRNDLYLEISTIPIIEPLKQIVRNTEREGEIDMIYDDNVCKQIWYANEKDNCDEIEKSQLSIESLRNYIHNNGLYLNPDHYDAKERKIEHVAAPKFDTDAVNKRYIERTLRDSRNEIEKMFKTLGNDMIVRALQGTKEKVSEMEKSLNVLKNAVTIESLKEMLDMIEKSVKRIGHEMIVCALKNVMMNEALEKTIPDMINKSVQPIGNDISKMKKDIAKVQNDTKKLLRDARKDTSKV